MTVSSPEAEASGYFCKTPSGVPRVQSLNRVQGFEAVNSAGVRPGPEGALQAGVAGGFGRLRPPADGRKGAYPLSLSRSATSSLNTMGSSVPGAIPFLFHQPTLLPTVTSPRVCSGDSLSMPV